MFEVDLETLTVRDSGRLLVDRGTPLDGFSVDGNPITFPDLERLYGEYAISTPRKSREGGRHYFRAKPFSELSPAQLVSGRNRDQAERALLMAIVTGILNGSLIWPDPSEWYWQSETYPDFVLLRRWFTGS